MTNDEFIWKLSCNCNSDDKFYVYLEKETHELVAECVWCNKKHYITREEGVEK